MKSVAFHNLGCKVNSYETDVMQQKLLENGFRIVPFDEKADVYVINTCSVTNIADRKSRQMLHRAKKQNPDAVVVAVGCYVETDPERIQLDPAIDLAVGNNRKNEIAECILQLLKERESRRAADNAGETAYNAEDLGREYSVDFVTGHEEADEETARRETVAKNERETSDQSDRRILANLTDHPVYEEMQLTAPGHTRAYIKIQDGCNQFCSYCIIPYARGRIRSRLQEDILREVKGLARDGVKEIVLTGIHISSYGLDREGSELLELLQKLQKVEGIERIRLGSLEPRIITEEFAQEASKLTKLCPHFHLSLQSGCDTVLKRMNRHYTTAEYAESVERLRRVFERPAICTDIIVGFPGETEEEFESTMEFVKQIDFYEIHVFKYSMRHGTVAAGRKDQIPESVKAVRSDKLLEVTERQAGVYRDSFLQQEEEILLEEEMTAEGKTYLCGHTMRYVKGAVPAVQGLGSGMMVRGRFIAEIPGTDSILLQV